MCAAGFVLAKKTHTSIQPRAETFLNKRCLRNPPATRNNVAFYPTIDDRAIITDLHLRLQANDDDLSNSARLGRQHAGKHFSASPLPPSPAPILLFHPGAALWCQLSVLAFTRQMLVCHTLSLIPARTRPHANAHARLNATVSAGLSNRATESRDSSARRDTPAPSGGNMQGCTAREGLANNMQTIVAPPPQDEDVCEVQLPPPAGSSSHVGIARLILALWFA